MGWIPFPTEIGGRGEIRTLGGFDPSYAFQAYDLIHSSTPPYFAVVLMTLYTQTAVAVFA